MPQADAAPEDGDLEAGVPPGPDGFPGRDADVPGAESKRRRLVDEAGAALGGPGWAGGGYSDVGRTPLLGPGGRTPVPAERTPLYTDRTPPYTDTTPLYTDAHVPNEGRRRP